MSDLYFDFVWYLWFYTTTISLIEHAFVSVFFSVWTEPNALGFHRRQAAEPLVLQCCQLCRDEEWREHSRLQWAIHVWSHVPARQGLRKVGVCVERACGFIVTCSEWDEFELSGNMLGSHEKRMGRVRFADWNSVMHDENMGHECTVYGFAGILFYTLWFLLFGILLFYCLFYIIFCCIVLFFHGEATVMLYPTVIPVVIRMQRVGV